MGGVGLGGGQGKALDWDKSAAVMEVRGRRYTRAQRSLRDKEESDSPPKIHQEWSGGSSILKKKEMRSSIKYLGEKGILPRGSVEKLARRFPRTEEGPLNFSQTKKDL